MNRTWNRPDSTSFDVESGFAGLPRSRPRAPGVLEVRREPCRRHPAGMAHQYRCTINTNDRSRKPQQTQPAPLQPASASSPTRRLDLPTTMTAETARRHPATTPSLARTGAARAIPAMTGSDARPLHWLRKLQTRSARKSSKQKVPIRRR